MQQRLQSRWGIALAGIALPLFLAACRHAAPASPPSGAASRRTVEDPLRYVLQRDPHELPTRIDPSGRWIAILEGSDCAVWDLLDNIYRGRVPAARCADWLPLATETVRSSEAKPVAAAAATVPPGVRSPDGERQAELGEAGRELRIVSTASGQLLQIIRIPDNRHVIGRLFAWGVAGLVAVVALAQPVPVPASDPEDSEKGLLARTDVATLEQWRSLDAPSQALSRVALHAQASDVALDPSARWLFMTEPGSSRPSVEAFLISPARPDGPRQPAWPAPGWLSLHFPDRHIVSMEDETESAPIRRADGEGLVNPHGRCPHTTRGVFDCVQNCMATALFLLGPDPVTARLLRGYEIGSRLYHPGLVEDFFNNRPVAPLPLD